jgi:multiple RNA-binding domain-containing protein 1
MITMVGDKGAKDTWNHLFIASNTALEATAAKYGATKADIVGPDSDNSAVKAALAETQVIKEAKEFLKEQGINVDIFSQRYVLLDC